MSEQRSLFLWELLDLSIGTPQPGAVNFTALHALLHAVLQHLGLRDVKTRWTDSARGPAAVGVTGSGSEEEEEEEVPPGTELQVWTTSASDPESSPGTAGKEGEEFRSCIRSCEAGVSEAMRLAQELHEQTDDLKEEVKELRLQQKIFADSLVAVETCCHRVDDLDGSLNHLRDRMQTEAELVSEAVTWEQLRRVLLQEELENVDSTSDPRPSPVRTQAPPPSSASGHVSNLQCYPETVEALRSGVRLGAELRGLGAELRGLEARVAAVEGGKVDRSELTPLRDAVNNRDVQDESRNLSDQLNQQRTLMSGLSSEQEKSVELVREVQKMMVQLQTDCEKLQETTRRLQDDSRRMQRVLEGSEEGAAHAHVSRLQFDSVTERLSSMFHELLHKVTGQEQDWNKVVHRLSTEMEHKLNRMELDSVKKQLEDRWKNIHEKLQTQEAPEHDDAAGIRKQLVDRFHCLSCDRPVVKHTPGPYLVTLPSTPAFPSHKSIRPFTVYALEQVRQHYRGERFAELHDYSPEGVARSCGGGHTLTSANQRRGGPHFLKHCSQPEVDTGIQSEEVDIVGLDGHIYRGRLNGSALRHTETKLPTIASKEGLRTKSKTWHRPAASPEAAGDPAGPPAVRSAPCSRSASSNSARDWPVSALGCSSQSSIAPPPGPRSSAPPDGAQASP